MKKFYAILGGGFLLFMLCSCSENVISTPGGPDVPEEPKVKLELQYDAVNLPCDGGVASVEVYTNQDEWEAVTTNKEWLTLEVRGNKVILSTDAANSTNLQRNAVVTITAGSKGKTVVKDLQVYQNSNAMILEYTVRASSEIRAPIYGKVDCLIDWGDGQVEPCKKENIDNFMTMSPTHIYYNAGTYRVTISGSVAALNTGLGFTEEMASYLTGVIQWGNLGLTSMVRAFAFCSNLRSVANDDDKAFADVLSFSNTFASTGLLEIPENLFRYASKATDFGNTFNATQITQIPAQLLANCVSATKMNGLFSYTPIMAIPDGLFDNCREVTNFSSCFTQCSFVRHIPEELFYNNPLVQDFSYIFRDCSALTSIPETLFSQNPEATSMTGLFTFCYSLTSIPGKLFANNTQASKFTYAFANCTSLKSVPVELFDNCKRVLSFQGALRECLSVTGETPYTVIEGKKVHLYERSQYPAYFTAPETGEKCFQNSVGFSDYETIKTKYPFWS